MKFEISFFLNSIKSVTSCNNTVTIDTVLGIDGLLFSPENLSDLSLSLGHVWDTLHWSGSSPEGTSFWTPVTFTTGSVYLQPSLDVSFIAHQCIRPQHWLQAAPRLKVAPQTVSYSLTKYTRTLIPKRTGASVRLLPYLFSCTCWWCTSVSGLANLNFWFSVVHWTLFLWISADLNVTNYVP